MNVKQVYDLKCLWVDGYNLNNQCPILRKSKFIYKVHSFVYTIYVYTPIGFTTVVLLSLPFISVTIHEPLNPNILVRHHSQQVTLSTYTPHPRIRNPLLFSPNCKMSNLRWQSRPWRRSPRRQRPQRWQRSRPEKVNSFSACAFPDSTPTETQKFDNKGYK